MQMVGGGLGVGAQQVEVLVVKPEDLSFIAGTHLVDNDTHALRPAHTNPGTHASILTLTSARNRQMHETTCERHSALISKCARGQTDAQEVRGQLQPSWGALESQPIIQTHFV